jgi:hypothetical protein
MDKEHSSNNEHSSNKEQSKELYQENKDIINIVQDEYYIRKKNLKQAKDIKKQTIAYKKFNFPIVVSFN